MITSFLKKNIFYVLLGFFIFLHSALICVTRIFPFVDLPNHLAAATIYRYYNDPQTLFSHFFDIQLFFKPNVIHLIFCSLPVFPSVECANKVYLCIYVMLFPVSVFLVIKKIGGNIWYTFLSFLFLYNFNMRWGFVEFVMAIPFIFLLVYFLLSYRDHERLSYKIAISSMLTVIFFIHGLAVLFSLLIFFLWALYTYRNAWKKLTGVLCLSMPVLLCVVLWQLSEPSYEDIPTVRFIIDYYRHTYFAKFIDRRGLFYTDNMQLYEGNGGCYAALLISLSIIISLLWKIVLNWRNNRSAFLKIIRKPSGKGYVILFGFITLICFLLLPEKIPGQPILYERFAVLVLLATLIISSIELQSTVIFQPKPLLLISTILFLMLYGICYNTIIPAIVFTVCSGIGYSMSCSDRIKKGVVLGMCSLHFVAYTEYFSSFQKETAQFTPDLFPAQEPGKVLAGLIYDLRFRECPMYIHFPAYYIVWKKGIAVNSFMDYRFGIIRRKCPVETIPVYLDWVGTSEKYDGRYNNCDFLLICGYKKLDSLIEPEKWSMKNISGTWTLWEKKPFVR